MSSRSKGKRFHYFSLWYGEMIEQFVSPFEVSFVRRNQQTFSESTRTAQEIALFSTDHIVEQRCLVDIDISPVWISPKLWMPTGNFIFRLFHFANITHLFQTAKKYLWKILFKIVFSPFLKCQWTVPKALAGLLNELLERWEFPYSYRSVSRSRSNIFAIWTK